MADIFVSYKREDAARVRKLVEVLRAAGLATWWDEDIPASAPWEATIERALSQAKAVIVCWSPDAVASDNVRSEARVAREDGRLIQVFLRSCQPPLFFGEQQGVDLSNWRGKSNDPRIAKIVETARKVAAGEGVEGGGPRRQRTRFDARVAFAAAAFLLVIALAGSWWFLMPPKETGPPTLAVLPFRALNSADANLVDGIWDDTRGALARNPNLRVIGRRSMEAVADQHLEPAAYRSKLGADYLLDGSVQHVGDQVQMKLSLVRTKDAVEVWSDQIGGKLDDVFAFQQRVANEVEGRIRGRVAPGGGVSDKNIITSGEVYAIYAEAGAKLRQRRGSSYDQAISLLKQAVALDPNYAPAWADLGEATTMCGCDGTAEEVRAEANADVGRALILAPNLAHAYAVRAFIRGSEPAAEIDFRKAVALDPNDGEAWMWLGNWFADQNRIKEALQAHSRAVEIEPLWFNTMFNKMDDYARLADREGLAAELRRAEGMSDPYLTLRAREHEASLTGQIGDAARNLFEIRRRFPDQARPAELGETLITLGFINEAFALMRWLPADDAALYRGVPLSTGELRKRYPNAKDFWTYYDVSFVNGLYGRLLPKHGRLSEYADYYKRAFRSADDYYAAVEWAGWPNFTGHAPNVAANLREAGEKALAQQILDKDEAIMEPLLRNGPSNLDMAWRIAQLRAAENQDDEAIVAMRRAVDQGWVPDARDFATDIADEPCFVHLANRADFQAIRMQILNHIEQQRRHISPAVLARAGLAVKSAA